MYFQYIQCGTIVCNNNKQTTNICMIEKRSKTLIRKLIMAGRCICDCFINSVASSRTGVSFSSAFQLKTVCFIFHVIASAH